MDSVFGGMSQDGTLQQYILVPDDWIVESPPHLTVVEAASFITAGTTAWTAIRGSLDLRLDGVLEPWDGEWTKKRLQGKTVLTMGTGGVSCFAIQVRPHLL
jgi:NADPH:quinone reductase-like Zn-dependent oxidoreductase